MLAAGNRSSISLPRGTTYHLTPILTISYGSSQMMRLKETGPTFLFSRFAALHCRNLFRSPQFLFSTKFLFSTNCSRHLWIQTHVWAISNYCLWLALHFFMRVKVWVCCLLSAKDFVWRWILQRMHSPGETATMKVVFVTRHYFFFGNCISLPYLQGGNSTDLTNVAYP